MQPSHATETESSAVEGEKFTADAGGSDTTRARKGWTALRAWAAAIAGVITFGLAVLGSYTGLAAYRDAKRITVSVRASPLHDYDLGADGRIQIHAVIVNLSSRTVNVVGGSVDLDGRRMASLASVAVGGSAERDFPVPIEPGSSVGLRSLFVLRVSNGQGRGKFDRLFQAFDHPRRHTLRLHLSLEPGKSRTVTIGLNSTSESGPTRDENLYRSPGWGTPTIGLHRGRVTFIHPTWDGPSTAPVAIARLEVFNAKTPEAVVRTSRPTFEDMPLGHLAPGRYSWALTVSGKVVESGVFHTPCRVSPPNRRGGFITECEG